MIVWTSHVFVLDLKREMIPNNENGKHHGSFSFWFSSKTDNNMMYIVLVCFTLFSVFRARTRNDSQERERQVSRMNHTWVLGRKSMLRRLDVVLSRMQMLFQKHTL